MKAYYIQPKQVKYWSYMHKCYMSGIAFRSVVINLVSGECESIPHIEFTAPDNVTPITELKEWLDLSDIIDSMITTEDIDQLSIFEDETNKN